MPTRDGHMIRAGDAVLHHPSKETWLVATDEESGEFLACGWPETLAKAKDCTLDRAATDEKRHDLLVEIAAGTQGLRGRTARRLLSNEGHDVDDLVAARKAQSSALLHCDLPAEGRGSGLKRKLRDWNDIAMEALEAELVRRKSGPVPTPVENPDFSGLVEHLKDHVKRIAETGQEHDDDERYAYEEAMKAVFGPGIFDDFINVRME